MKHFSGTNEAQNGHKFWAHGMLSKRCFHYLSRATNPTTHLLHSKTVTLLNRTHINTLGLLGEKRYPLLPLYKETMSNLNQSQLLVIAECGRKSVLIGKLRENGIDTANRASSSWGRQAISCSGKISSTWNE